MSASTTAAATASGSESRSDMKAGFDPTADYRVFTYHGGALEVARLLVPHALKPWMLS